MQKAFAQRLQDDENEMQARANICNSIPGTDQKIKAYVGEKPKLAPGRYDVGDKITQGSVVVSYDDKDNPKWDFKDLNFRNSQDREIAIDSMYAAGGAEEGRKITLELPQIDAQLDSPENTEAFKKEERDRIATDLLLRATGMKDYQSTGDKLKTGFLRGIGLKSYTDKFPDVSKLVQDYDKSDGATIDPQAYEAYIKHYQKYGDQRLNLEISGYTSSPKEQIN